MHQIIRRPSADLDLVAIFRDLALRAGLRVADRFFAQAESTIARLAERPGLGTRYDPDDQLLVDLR